MMKKYKYIIRLLCIALVIGCNNFKRGKVFYKNNAYEIGNLVNDSLFNGIVELRNKQTDKLIAKSNYYYGLLNGFVVYYNNDGQMIDSSNYHYGKLNGYRVINDSITGIRKYKFFYYQGHRIGHQITYNSSGLPLEYLFYNFENDMIFKMNFINDSTCSLKGDNFNFHITTQNDIKDKHLLFIYILENPFYKSYYTLDILDVYNKSISSVILKSDDCFVEKNIEKLQSGFHYALIYHEWNNRKGVYDVEILPLDFPFDKRNKK